MPGNQVMPVAREADGRVGSAPGPAAIAGQDRPLVLAGGSLMRFGMAVYVHDIGPLRMAVRPLIGTVADGAMIPAVGPRVAPVALKELDGVRGERNLGQADSEDTVGTPLPAQ